MTQLWLQPPPAATLHTDRHSQSRQRQATPNASSPRYPLPLPISIPIPIPRLHARRKWLYVTCPARLDRRQRVARRDSSHIPARQGCPLRLRCSARYALSDAQHFTCLLANTDRSLRLPRWRPPLYRPHVGPPPASPRLAACFTSPPRLAPPANMCPPPVWGSDSVSVKPEQFSDTPSVKTWVENYLWVGETVMDQSVAFFSSSSYFERKR